MSQLPEQFIARRRSDWERLTVLLDKTRAGGPAALAPEELFELGRLYRSATSDLSTARRDFAQHPVATYLNDLAARGYATLYRSESARGRDFWRFFSHTFPQAFRGTWRFSLVAALLLFLPALGAYLTAWADPAAGAALVPGAEAVIKEIRAEREWWLSINDEGNASSAAFIMTNNIRVSILAFAGGILLGVPSALVLIQNGMLLGVVGGAAHAYGFSDRLWGFVAAHGVIELSVIAVAGGAGLQLGWALVRPGLITRSAALAQAARRAIHLLLGGALLLVIAGIIEGFVSPSTLLPTSVKYLVALTSGVALYAYLLLAGRPARDRRG